MATKAELKKEESKRRREFHAKLLGIVFDVTNESMQDVQSKLDFKVSFTGRNRYVRFSVYGFKMSVLIYTRGQLVIQLEEACHGTFEQQIYEYTDNQEEQQECLERLERIMRFMIPLFTNDGIVDAHTFMDYVKDDLEDAYARIEEDWKRYDENN